MPEESPHPIVTDLVTGHYHQTRGYRAWRAHGTTDWLLILTLAGRGHFGEAAGSEIVVEEGDVVLLRPGTRHDYGIAPGAEAWELLWAHFRPRPAWHEWLVWPERTAGVMLLTLGEPIIRQKITTRLRDAHRLATGTLARRDVFAMNALEEALLWCDTQNPRAQPSRLDPRVQAAVDFLSAHLSERVTLEDLAVRSGLSASRLAHLFRAQAGLTPQQFQEQQRLARARQLLERTSQPVGSIAAEVGFDNPFYFTLRFKRDTGLSPRDWRRRAQETATETGAD